MEFDHSIQIDRFAISSLFTTCENTHNLLTRIKNDPTRMPSLTNIILVSQIILQISFQGLSLFGRNITEDCRAFSHWDFCIN